MLTTIQVLFDAWNDAGVNYCHWKSTNHLGDTIWGRTDLDVVVDPATAGTADQVLIDAGFREFHTVPLRSYPGITDFVCLDPSGVWVHVHLHYRLILGDRWVKAYWLPSRGVLARRRFAPELRSYVIAPRDELSLFCVRMALKFRRPFADAGVRDEFEYLRAKVMAEGTNGVDERPILPEISDFVTYASAEEAPSVRRLDSHARKTRRAMRAHRRFGPFSFNAYSSLRQTYRYWVEFKRRILKRFDTGRRRLPHGGVLVAFVGIDGSGKTSAVRRMEGLFAKQMNVERVFLGNGQSGASWYRALAFRLLGTRARFKRHRSIRASHGDQGRSGGRPLPWYYAAWMLLCTSDKAMNLRKAISAKANGSLVLADRWPQGQRMATCDGPRLLGRGDLTGLGTIAASREADFYEHAAAVRPDLIVRLTVSPEMACQRKPGEFTVSEASETAEVLGSIDWGDIRVAEVDADADMDTVDRVVRTAIWSVVQS